MQQKLRKTNKNLWFPTISHDFMILPDCPSSMPDLRGSFVNNPYTSVDYPEIIHSYLLVIHALYPYLGDSWAFPLGPKIMEMETFQTLKSENEKWRVPHGAE